MAVLLRYVSSGKFLIFYELKYFHLGACVFVFNQTSSVHLICFFDSFRNGVFFPHALINNKLMKPCDS